MTIPRLLFAVTASLWLLDSPAFAQTVCPTDFSCGFSAVATQAITHTPDDGKPYSAVGVLKFDSSGGVSVTTTINTNGQASGPYSVGSGTCTTDLSGIGTIQFPAAGNASFNFVTTDGGRELRFINATLSGVSLAGVGLCKVQ